LPAGALGRLAVVGIQPAISAISGRFAVVAQTDH
jgi:hypothetical protein